MELITTIHTQTVLVSMAYTTLSCADMISRPVKRLITLGSPMSPNALLSATNTRLALLSPLLVDTVISSVSLAPTPKWAAIVSKHRRTL
jgi:hypothetical protein